MTNLFVAAQYLLGNLASRVLVQLVQLIKMIFYVACAIAMRRSTLHQNFFTSCPIWRHDETCLVKIRRKGLLRSLSFRFLLSIDTHIASYRSCSDILKYVIEFVTFLLYFKVLTCGWKLILNWLTQVTARAKWICLTYHSTSHRCFFFIFETLSPTNITIIGGIVE